MSATDYEGCAIELGAVCSNKFGGGWCLPRITVTLPKDYHGAQLILEAPSATTGGTPKLAIARALEHAYQQIDTVLGVAKEPAPAENESAETTAQSPTGDKGKPPATSPDGGAAAQTSKTKAEKAKAQRQKRKPSGKGK